MVKDPERIVCPANTWTKVLAETTLGFIYPAERGPLYRFVYRLAGSPAPVGNQNDDLILSYKGEKIEARGPIDVWVRSQDRDGAVLSMFDFGGQTYLTKPGGLQLDAFGRRRVSATGNRTDIEFLYNKQPDLVDEITNNGSVAHNGSSRDLTLSVDDAAEGSFAVMQTFPVPYTPGNSQLVELTGCLDNSGIGGGTAEVFLRSTVTGSTTEQTIQQSEWEPILGSVDFSKSQIFVIDFQSLKVGKIRYAIELEDGPQIATEIQNVNLRKSGYWQQATLPVFYKIYNTATSTIMELGYGNDQNAVGFRYVIASNSAATLRAICITVKSEGGEILNNVPGLPRSIDMGVTEKIVSTTLIPLISIRSKDLYAGFDNLIVCLIKSFFVNSNESIRWEIIEGGTLTNESWVDVDTVNSSVEYDISATAITGGRRTKSGYIRIRTSGGSSSKDPEQALNALGKVVMWNRHSSETGIVTVAAERLGSNNADVLAGIDWEEIR